MNEVTSEVYLMDCIEGMKKYNDKHFDLAVVDPPYGLGNRLSDGGGKLKNTPMAVLYKNKDWDILPSYEYWIELFRVSKNQIIFGANYFLEHLPATRGFICWDKKQDMPTLSACELIWTSFDKPAKMYKKVSTDLNRFHPTQKPIGVYDFCFQFAKVEAGMKILDTHLGSGSSRISANKNGLNFTGFEIDKDYFEAQEKRYKNFISQTRLF
jgi:site-specific DNA-methyltransferase (adenine-specific)